jgi:hypothetical protein
MFKPQMILNAMMLCATLCACCRQPAPPDTPEHGSTLKMFVLTGYAALTKELKDHKTLANAANSSSSSSRRSRRRNPKRTQLQNLWAHTAGTPQQQQQQDAACVAGSSSSPSTSAAAAAPSGASVLLPPPSKIRRWPLIPHIDLQLQVPPQLLLSYAVLAAVGLKKKLQLDCSAAASQQQQVPGDNQQWDRLWHQLSQQLQCQGADEESLQAVAQLLHEDLLETFKV